MITSTLTRPGRWALILLALAAAPRLGHAQSDVVEYYHLDAVGSVRAVTDASGNLVRLHDFKPFGEEVNVTFPNPDRQLFTGQERDQETALDYFGARYYRPDLGRFTTVDPGHVNGDIGDSQSWSPYASVRNNPLRFTDPTGTHYLIDVYSGGDFWVDTDIFSELSRFAYPYSLIGNSNSGGIYDSSGTRLGGYQYYNPFAAMIFEAGNRADAGLKAGAVGVGASAAIGATGGLAAGMLSGGVLSSPFSLFGANGPSIAGAIARVGNAKLANALNALYQVTDKIWGGTAAAVRVQLETGVLVGGKDHIIKALERATNLEGVLRTQLLSPADRQLAVWALQELRSALAGK